MNVIDRDNLMQLNAPIIDVPLNKYPTKKNINSLNTYNNSSGSYLVPFIDEFIISVTEDKIIIKEMEGLFDEN